MLRRPCAAVALLIATTLAACAPTPTEQPANADVTDAQTTVVAMTWADLDSTTLLLDGILPASSTVSAPAAVGWSYDVDARALRYTPAPGSAAGTHTTTLDVTDPAGAVRQVTVVVVEADYAAASDLGALRDGWLACDAPDPTPGLTCSSRVDGVTATPGIDTPRAVLAPTVVRGDARLAAAEGT
ncbi:hypothetical protein [Cellulomonas iranensis]|uniref:hypothetical protein n=1 Tax=Cellulomonas iranensis TaxID=76862 RepID=UPI0013D56C04|nr:hypothetical protein [Cellulomonas iranensis]